MLRRGNAPLEWGFPPPRRYWVLGRARGCRCRRHLPSLIRSGSSGTSRRTAPLPPSEAAGHTVHHQVGAAGIAGGQQQVRPGRHLPASRRDAGCGSAAPGRRGRAPAPRHRRSPAARCAHRSAGGGHGRRQPPPSSVRWPAPAAPSAAAPGAVRPVPASRRWNRPAPSRPHRLLGQRCEPRRNLRAGLGRQSSLTGQPIPAGIGADRQEHAEQHHRTGGNASLRHRHRERQLGSSRSPPRPRP